MMEPTRPVSLARPLVHIAAHFPPASHGQAGELGSCAVVHTIHTRLGKIQRLGIYAPIPSPNPSPSRVIEA